MKVLFVVPGNNEGSNFIFSQREFKYHRNRGTNMIIFFLDTSPGFSFSLFANVIRLAFHIKKTKPDIIHAQYGTITAFAVAVAGIGKKKVITFRGSDLNPDPFLGTIRSCVGRFLSHFSSIFYDKVICVSHELKKRLNSNVDVVVLPTGVDTEVFIKMDKAEARLILGLKLDKKYVLFNTSRSPGLKRESLAREVEQMMIKSNIDVEFIYINGQYKPELVPVLISAVDTVLLLSINEGSPTILQEAVACETAVVAVEVGDVMELSKGLSSFYVVKPIAADVKNKLIESFDSTVCSSEVQEKLKHYSLSFITEKIHKIYESLSGIA